MERYTYPHTIENGGGERITILRRVNGPAGDRLDVENRCHQVEALTVVRGRIGYQRLGGPPSTPDRKRRSRVWLGNPRKRPAWFDVAYMVTRYQNEFSMQEIPAAVQRLLFPLLITIGRLFGKYARYADAPEPVRR